jgi:hypothetical protein
MVRKMNMGMQNFGIGRMLANTRVQGEMVDIKAHLDSTLNYRENADNIRKQMGITTRNYGMERMEQRQAERMRERHQRQDPNRQTGRWQNAHNIEIDRRFQAMRPGKRFSRTGHRYYERRASRSDVGRLL